MGNAVAVSRPHALVKAGTADIGPDVLGMFAKEWRMVMAGEEANAKLLYLIGTSRLFAKPMHAAIKGPSSAGKSEIRKHVLAFFPPEEVISFTTLSEKALLYDTHDYFHKILSMGEAMTQGEQKLQDYLLRELMSDGKIVHKVTEKVKGRGTTTRDIIKEGPVSFLVTTTKHHLHHENETRMLSLEVNDSPEQTHAVMLKIAEKEGLNQTPQIHYRAWHELQRELRQHSVWGGKQVCIPYAMVLANMIPAKTLRLRRDVSHLLTAIKAHALLHFSDRFVPDPEVSSWIRHKRIAYVVVAPTGSGKTCIASELIRRSENSLVLFLAHRRELIHQAQDKLKSFCAHPGVTLALARQHQRPAVLAVGLQR